MGKTIQVQEHIKYKICNYCGKYFKFNIGLKKHIEKCCVNLYECTVCKYIIEKSDFNEHMQTHKNGLDIKIDSALNVKLYKLNCGWKSKLICVYKCKICFEKFESISKITKHVKIHSHSYDDDTINYESLNISFQVDELNDNIQQIHEKSQLECQECCIKFDKNEMLNLHLGQCSKSFRNIWRKFRNNDNTHLQVSHTYTSNGSILSENSWSKCMNDFQQHQNCIKPNGYGIDQKNNDENDNSSSVKLYVQNIDDCCYDSYKNSLCTNNTVYNNLNQINLVSISNNESIVQTETQNVIPTDYSVTVGYKSSPSIIVSENQSNDIYLNATNSNKIISQNVINKNYCTNVSNPCTHVAESHCSNQIDTANSNGSIVQCLSLDPVSLDENPKNSFDSKTINGKSKSLNKKFVHNGSSIFRMTTRSSQIFKTYNCQSCDRCFKRKASYNNHMKLHNFIQNMKVQNDDNKNSNTVKTKKSQHKDNYNSSKSLNINQIDLDTTNSNINTAQCLMTDSVSIVENSNNSLEDKTKNGKSLNKQFLHNDSLTFHMTTRSSQIYKTYNCQSCDRRFKRNASYNNHIKLHNFIQNRKVQNVNKNPNIVTTKKNQQKDNYNSFKSSSNHQIDEETINSNKKIAQCLSSDLVSLDGSFNNSLKDKTKNGKSLNNQFTQNIKILNVKRNNLNLEKTKKKFVENLHNKNCSNSKSLNSSISETNINKKFKKTSLSLPCDQCDTKFSTRFTLILHRASHHNLRTLYM